MSLCQIMFVCLYAHAESCPGCCAGAVWVVCACGCVVVVGGGVVGGAAHGQQGGDGGHQQKGADPM